jgi:hypothetical protein
LLLELAAAEEAGVEDFFSDEPLDDVDAAAGVDDDPESDDDDEVDEDELDEDDELESDDDGFGPSELRWLERESLR